MTKTIVNHCSPNEFCLLKSGHQYVANSFMEGNNANAFALDPIHATVFSTPMEALVATYNFEETHFEIVPNKNYEEKRIESAFQKLVVLINRLERPTQNILMDDEDWDELRYMRDMALKQAKGESK